MEHQVIILNADTTLTGVTVTGIWYKGFYTYGMIEVDGVTYSVKTYEGWNTWEVAR